MSQMKSIIKLTLHQRRVHLPAGVANQQAEPYGAKITQPQRAAQAVARLLRNEPQEVFLVVLLDVQNQIIGYQEAHRGGIDTCGVDPRVVFRVAIVSGASGIIVAHNHPSGGLAPSTADIMLTERLCQAGQLLGIRVLDSLVIGEGGRFTSLAECGLIPAQRTP